MEEIKKKLRIKIRMSAARISWFIRVRTIEEKEREFEEFEVTSFSLLTLLSKNQGTRSSQRSRSDLRQPRGKAALSNRAASRMPARQIIRLCILQLCVPPTNGNELKLRVSHVKPLPTRENNRTVKIKSWTTIANLGGKKYICTFVIAWNWARDARWPGRAWKAAVILAMVASTCDNGKGFPPGK